MRGRGRRTFSGIAVTVLVTFVTIVVTSTLVAMSMGPFINESFGQMIRDPDGDGLLLPALLGGYAIIAFGLVWWLYPQVFPTPPRWPGAALFGGVVGLMICLGDHLVTAGRSRMPAWSMALSGVLDAAPFVITAVTLRWVYAHGRANSAST